MSSLFDLTCLISNKSNVVISEIMNKKQKSYPVCMKKKLRLHKKRSRRRDTFFSDTRNHFCKATELFISHVKYLFLSAFKDLDSKQKETRLSAKMDKHENPYYGNGVTQSFIHIFLPLTSLTVSFRKYIYAK